MQCGHQIQKGVGLLRIAHTGTAMRANAFRYRIKIFIIIIIIIIIMYGAARDGAIYMAPWPAPCGSSYDDVMIRAAKYTYLQLS